MARKIGGKTAGRRRVEMKKIERKDALQVTFSKRRNGLFKKAFELSILCGSNFGVFLFSPGGRAYSFGSPDIPRIIHRFFNNGDALPQDPNGDQAIHVEALSKEFMEITQHREMMIKRRSDLTKALVASGYLDESKLDIEKLKERICAMEKFKELVVARKTELEFQMAQNQLGMFAMHTNLNNLGSHHGTTGDRMSSYEGEMQTMNMMVPHYANINLMTFTHFQQLLEVPSLNYGTIAGSSYQGEMSTLDMVNPNYVDINMTSMTSSQQFLHPLAIPNEYMISQVGLSNPDCLNQGEGSTFSNSVVEANLNTNLNPLGLLSPD